MRASIFGRNDASRYTVPIPATRGESVGTIAQSLGYASPNAFTSMFRKLPGKTPQHYLAEWRERA
ncbi:AraC family transcriptional regulator [Massilia putida]|uniref:AraC family transcriptional regulator n=1 Tax=Massilia putida TaxID=1141883 RepID=UPI0009515183|nr:AraC family transcriptional regulator [Massilia putida]